MVDAWPKFGLSLVTINLLSEPLLRPHLYSYRQYKCTAASLGIAKMKKLVKMMKWVQLMKLSIMRLRTVSGSPEKISQSQAIKELWSTLDFPGLGSALYLAYEDTLILSL